MKFLSSYYFRAHMYTIVPRHVREDMEWMADVGTDALVIGVLEQDLTAAVENMGIIATEAERARATLISWSSVCLKFSVSKRNMSVAITTRGAYKIQTAR